MSKARENLLRVRDNINEVLIGNPDAEPPESER